MNSKHMTSSTPSQSDQQVQTELAATLSTEMGEQAKPLGSGFLIATAAVRSGKQDKKVGMLSQVWRALCLKLAR